MKYFTILLTIFSTLFFTWCIQNNKQTEQPIISWELSNSVPTQTWKEQSLWGNFILPIFIDWIYFPIIISWNVFIYSWIFTINMPQEIDAREYMSTNDVLTKTYREWMWFTSNDKKKSFSLNIRKIVWPDTTYSGEDLCKVEYYDWFLSRSEEIKNIQGKIIYIYYADLMVSAPDIKPFKVIDTQFCLINSGMIYEFSASNYTHAYMEDIINSLQFN